MFATVLRINAEVVMHILDTFKKQMIRRPPLTTGQKPSPVLSKALTTFALWPAPQGGHCRICSCFSGNRSNYLGVSQCPWHNFLSLLPLCQGCNMLVLLHSRLSNIEIYIIICAGNMLSHKTECLLSFPSFFGKVVSHLTWGTNTILLSRPPKGFRPG